VELLANVLANAALDEPFAAFVFGNSPLAIVIVLSVVIGLLMVVIFGYTSDQKAIKVAKDQLKAHLLAVRLYRDQLPVVMGSYGKILRGTGRYLKLAFKPLIYVIIPITILIVYVDRYLGSTPIAVGSTFLVTASTSNLDALDKVTLEAPPEIAITAPPVHVPAENEVVWRLVASKPGDYEIKLVEDGQSMTKSVSIADGLAKISTQRLRDRFWERIFTSGEPALPSAGSLKSISIGYPERKIDIAGYGMNWIWLFFILSMIAGFAFKEILGIQI
jgi:uncharacterized membrane protein (DUF106 family)